MKPPSIPVEVFEDSAFPIPLEQPTALAPDPVAKSKAAFADLLKARDGLEKLEKPQLEPILDFLQTSSDEPGARNTQSLLWWLQDRTLSVHALDAVVDLINDKITLGTLLLNDLERVLARLPHLKTHDPLSTLQSPTAKPGMTFRHYKKLWETLELRYLANRTELVIPVRMYKNLINAIAAYSTEHSTARLVLSIYNRAGPKEAAEDVSEILHILRVTLRPFTLAGKHSSVDEDRLSARLATLLSQISGEHAESVIAEITSYIVSHSNTPAAKVSRLDQVLFWLYCLRRCTHMRANDQQSNVWSRVYEQLAPAFKLVDLAPHFKLAKAPDMVPLILRHWAPLQPRTNTTGLSHGLTLKLSYNNPPVQQVDVLPLISELDDLREEKDRAKTALTDIPLALARRGLPYHTLLRDILDLAMRIDKPAGVFALWFHIRREPKLGIDVATAAKLVEYFLHRGKPGQALEILQAVPTMPLPPSLLLELAERNAGSTNHIFDILLRRTTSSCVPSLFRTVKRCSLSKRQIDMVHSVAHALAHSSQLTSRMAFRRVWLCYRFLRDRMAPLAPTLSRAFVHAGVVRPIRERVWISTAKFKYVLELVERLEGKAVAEQLDRIVWLERGKIIAELKAKKRESLGTTVESKEVLTSARFRAWAWTKERPERRVDEQSGEVYFVGKQDVKPHVWPDKMPDDHKDQMEVHWSEVIGYKPMTDEPPWRDNFTNT